MQRYLQNELLNQIQLDRQMIFLSGPRQVGKTTISKNIGDKFDTYQYISWDNEQHRELILSGTEPVAEALGLSQLQAKPPLCVFDELHKYKHWRDFLKGFFDRYEKRVKTLVTGSATFDTFKRGGDSLMGRYFPYTLHPISVAECVANRKTSTLISAPAAVEDEIWDTLKQFGGFPEPFLKRNKRFYNRWRALRTEQLFREDLRDLTRIQELDQIQMLAALLRQQAGQLTSYTSLSKSIRVSVDTIRRWLITLESFYYCFSIRPWHKNVARSLRKEPKYYLWDWSEIDDPGAKAENMVASALFKATDFWTETGEGKFELYFLRDKQKREVDFLVTKDNTPWFLVEVKQGAGTTLSKSLAYFQGQTGAEHAFQVAMDLPFVNSNCFNHREPIIVPARTFLSQLV